MPNPDNLGDLLRRAYESALQSEGGAPESLGAFVDEQARALEARGEPKKGRRLRDWLGEQQAAALPKTRRAAGEAWASAIDEGLGEDKILLWGRPPTLMERDEARLAQAEIAGQPTAPPAGSPLPWTDLEPRLQMEVLEAAGVKTEGMVETDVREAFAREFGDQIPTPEAAQKAREYLWRQRAIALQDEEEPNPAKQVQFNRESEDLARTYVGRVEAERRAKAAAQAAPSLPGAALTAVRQNVIGPIADVGAGIGNLFREQPVTGAEVAHAVTGDMAYLQDPDVRAVIDAASDVPALNLMRAGISLGTMAVPLRGLSAAANVGLRAAKVGGPMARGLSTALSLGTWNALTTAQVVDPLTGEVRAADFGDRMESAGHGVVMGLVAGPVGGAFLRGLERLPPRLANAAAEALGFLAGDFAASGGDVSNEQALHDLILGAAMGAARATTPGRERAEAARLVVRQAFQAMQAQGIRLPLPGGGGTLVLQGAEQMGGPPPLPATRETPTYDAEARRARTAYEARRQEALGQGPGGWAFTDAPARPESPEVLAAAKAHAEALQEAARKAQEPPPPPPSPPAPPAAQTPAAPPQAPPAPQPSPPRRALKRPHLGAGPGARGTDRRKALVPVAIDRRQAVQERRSLESALYQDTTTGVRSQEAWNAAKPNLEAQKSHYWTGDLGDFKAVNDNLGHEKGNEALAMVGKRLREAAQAAGIPTRNLFRTGGDEFTVSGTQEQVAAFEKALARKPYIKIEGRRVWIDGATGPSLAEADANAYTAKAKRKGQPPRRILKTGVARDAGQTPTQAPPTEPPKKEEPNAVQQRQAETVPPRPPPGDRGAVGEGSQGEGGAPRAAEAPPRPPVEAPPAPTETPRAAPVEPAAKGRTTTIPVKGGSVESEYALIPIGSLRTSHDPTQDFAWREGYPRDVQERDYSTDKMEQMKVTKFQQGFNPAEVVNTAPRATDGPPTVTADGTVLNGNARGMALILLQKQGRWKEYQDYLRNHAADFGIDPSQVKEGLVLVRRVGMDPHSKEAADFGRLGQLTETQSIGPMADAARFLQVASDRVFDEIRSAGDTTVAEAVADPTRGLEFRRALAQSLNDAQRREYVNDDLTLTGKGRELAEDLVLLRGLSNPEEPATVRRAVATIASMPAGMRRTFANAAVQFLDLRKASPTGRRYVQGLLDAVDYWTNYMGQKEPSTWAEEQTQALKVNGQNVVRYPPIPVDAKGWIDWLYNNRNKPKVFREALSALVKAEKEVRREEQGVLKAVTEQTDPLTVLARVLDGWRPSSAEDSNAKVVDSGASLFGSPVTSPERLSEQPDSWSWENSPDPILGAPQASNGYAMDLPPMQMEPTAAWKGKQVRRSAIINALAKATHTLIRVGHFLPSERRKYAGFWKVTPEVQRIREANDFPTAIHESGHALEKMVYWKEHKDPNWYKKLPANVRAEGTALGRRLYGATIPNAGYFREGFAEFLKGWMIGSPDVKRLAPELLKWWEGSFLPNEPKWSKPLLKAKGLVEQYIAQGERNEGLAFLSEGPIKAALGARGVRQAKRWFSRWVEAAAPLKEAADTAEAAIQARLTPAQKAGLGKRRALRPGRDPYRIRTALRLTHVARARDFVHRGTRDVYGNARGPSLEQAVAPAIEHGKRKGWSSRETHGRLSLYLAARRAVEIVDRGMGNPGLDREKAVRIRDHLHSPEFDMAARNVYKWQNDVLDYAVSGGALSVQEANRIRAGQDNYVPFQRVVEAFGGADDVLRRIQGGKPLRRFKGSGLEIKDPFVSMIERAEKVIRWTHERMEMNALVLLRNLEGMGRFVERLPPEVEKQHVRLEKIARQIEKAGGDLSNANLDEFLEWWSPKQEAPRGKPIIAHRNAQTGQVEWYEVDPTLYEALHEVDFARLPRWLDASFGRFARGLRMGTTGLRPAFSLGTNLIRDQLTGYLQSATTDNPFKFLSDTARQLARTAARHFKDDPYADLFDALGLEMAMPLGVDTRQTRRAARELFAQSPTRRVVRTPIEHLRDVLQVPEKATRVSELRRMAAQVGWEPGQPVTLDQMVQMAEAAKQVTVDFTAAGSWARAVNQVVPFFNAQIQGTRSMFRAFKQHPVAAVLKGLSAHTIPALTLWFLHKDEDWYKDMPWREKFSHFWIPVGKEIVGIPRAFDWDNVFSVVWEATADAAYRKDPEAVLQAFGNIFDTTALQYLPWSPTKGFDFGALMAANPVTEVAWELATNRDRYSDRAIVPESEERMPAAEQVAPYTSGIARFVGEKLHLSPRQIDHAIRGFTGGLTFDVADMVDSLGKIVTGRDPGIGPRGPERGEFKDVPIIGGAFGRRGGKEGVGSLAVERLFDALDEARKIEASREVQETPEQRQRRLGLEDASKALKWLRLLQGAASTLEERQAIQREIRAIATRAMQEAGQRRFRMEASEAERRARDATSPPPGQRRILRPNR